jgi:hypothetical protein
MFPGCICQRIRAWRPESRGRAKSHRADRQHEVRGLRQNRQHLPRLSENTGSIFGALGASCTGEWGDPIAQYDRAADRWLLSQLGSFSAPYLECIAVSQTSDPTGAYNLYSYSFGNNLNDYPKIGAWPTATNSAYLATYNLFANAANYVGVDVCAFDRAAMLSSAAKPVEIITDPSGGFLPADLDGSTLPPAGAPGYFLNIETSSTLRLYSLTEFPLHQYPASGLLLPAFRGRFSTPPTCGRTLLSSLLLKKCSAGLGRSVVDAAAHRAPPSYRPRGLKLWTTRWPPFSPGKISNALCFAMLRLLPKRTGLYAARCVLVTIRGPHVTGLRIVLLVVAAMDHLFRPIFEFEHPLPERHWG